MASGRAAFALKKYSWSHDNNSNGKGNYNHLSADNIYLVVEGEQSARGRLILQIIQRTNILDEIDLGKHIDIAISTRETFQRIGRQIADKQLPTYAVSSANKLAITHRPEDGQVRRMQVALASQEDCSRIVDHLLYRGMVFVEAVQKSTNRPGTTDSDLRSVNTNASSLFQKDIDSTSVPKYRGVQRHNSQHAEREHRQASALSIGNTYTPSFLAQRSAHNLLVRDEDAAPREPRLDHPTPSQIFPRITTTQGTAETTSDPILAGRSDESARSLSSLFSSTNHETNKTFPSLFSNSAPTGRSSSASLWPSAHSRQSVKDLLPPERELPFDQPRRERSRSSSVLSLTALPKPQVKAGSARSISSKGETSSTQLRSEPTQAATSKVDVSSSDRITRSKRKHMELENEAEKDRQYISDMPPPRLLSSSDTTRSSPKDMHELLYGKRPRVSSIERPLGTWEEHDSAQSRDKSGHDEHTLLNLTSSVDKVIQTSQDLDLARYATLNHSERSKVLEKFMLDMLGNKDFATLCEDMSTCWSRLALGL